MELEQLRQFLKLAERQNFTRAAEEIGLSQSALSRSVSRLEAELGQPVFERQSRKIVLTDAGHVLKKRAEQVLLIIDDTIAEIGDDGETGRVRVAAIPTIAPFMLPSVLQQFGRLCPAAMVTVQEHTTDNLIKRLKDGEVDVAIVALPIEAKYLEVEDLFDEELLLVLPADHRLVVQESVCASDIESLPFVLLGEAHCLADNIKTFCQQQSFNPVSVERTSQLATVQELVSLNHGVSMVPRMAVTSDESKRRVYRSLSGKRPSRTVAMIWNPYRFQSRLLEKFKHVVREYGPTTGRTDASAGPTNLD